MRSIELRCAIAHLRISRFSDVQLHIIVRIFDAPRNDRSLRQHPLVGFRQRADQGACVRKGQKEAGATKTD
jgi:hypothetical protein